jgi:hypothetical protein
VTLEHAMAAKQDLGVGGRFHNMPTVSIIDRGANYSPEARKVFGNMSDLLAPTALVVDHAPTRVMLNFIIKAATLKAMAMGNINDTANVQFFKTEAEAVAWVDSLPK